MHHAYLIEGIREEIMPEVLEFIETLGVKTLANPDFYNISLDSFKIEDARNLKSAEYEKSFSLGKHTLRAETAALAASVIILDTLG